jgi:hypothetical protein
MFKVGQKVVCINDKNQVNKAIIGSLNPVKKDYIYTIRKINSYDGLIFEEFIRGFYYTGEEAGFAPNRFKPLEDNWVDELLCKIMSDVEAAELVSA